MTEPAGPSMSESGTGRLAEGQEPAALRLRPPGGEPAAPAQKGPRSTLEGPRHRREKPPLHHSREHRRRRLRRRGRRAYIRSVYFLPSLCTLGNAICGFGAMYVATLDLQDLQSFDHWTRFFAAHNFAAAAYLIFVAMIFDALDGRLARFTRHTTDFGGQLDSLSDVISFGAAPGFLMLEVFKSAHPTGILPIVSRLVWSIAALYMSCAAMRLARFNVSNEHGEQHHFSFLGLPSPGAGGAVAALVLMQQEFARDYGQGGWLSQTCIWALPVLVLAVGLLMISTIRYPHMVNRYMRGKRSIGRLLAVVAIVLLFLTAHRYVLAIGTISYALWGAFSLLYLRVRRSYRPAATAPPPQQSAP